MIYAAATLWLLVVVLLAWGVRLLWGGILKPRTVNVVLLPGTFVAQVGRVVALLITGAKVSNTALMEDEEKGEPATESSYESKLPVFGPMIVGFLPMLATGAAGYLVLTKLGGPLVETAARERIPAELPSSMAAFWDQFRMLLTMSENTLNAVVHADMPAWQLAGFVYLMTCLTVRMSPFEGNVRGHVGAIIATFGALALLNTVSPSPSAILTTAWPLVSICVGWLVLLMMISLLASGIVATVRGIASMG